MIDGVPQSSPLRNGSRDGYTIDTAMIERIEFDHEPPPGATERTGVNGWYELAEAEGGTRLHTTMEVVVELPLPRISAPAVTAAMKRVMGTMGDRFSRNLCEHLGVRG